MSKNKTLFDALRLIGTAVTAVTLTELVPELGYTKEQASTALCTLYLSGNAVRVQADSTHKSMKERDSSQYAYTPKRNTYQLHSSIVTKNKGKRVVTTRGDAMINRLLKRSARLQDDMNALLDDVAAMAEDYTKMSELVDRIKNA